MNHTAFVTTMALWKIGRQKFGPEGWSNWHAGILADRSAGDWRGGAWPMEEFTKHVMSNHGWQVFWGLWVNENAYG